MTLEQAREHINSLLPSELQGAKKRDTYICPFCANGSGQTGDGITTKDGGKHYKCFVCGFYGDYLDMLKKQHSTDKERDIFNLYGLDVESGSPPSRSAASDFAGIAGVPSQPSETTAPVIDYMEFFRQTAVLLQTSPDALSYLKGRGISPETAARFMLGYCPEWKSPAAVRRGSNPPPTRRIIIPTSRTGYTARSIDENTPNKYRLMKEGEAGFFNKKALHGTAPVFIVEAAIDAMSISEAGGEACALGSTSGVDKFLDMLDREPPTVPLILSLDKDEDGQSAQAKLKAGLGARKIAFYEINTSGEYKDPNEHLQGNRDAFIALVNSDPVEAARQEADAERAAYLETSAAHHVAAYMGAVADSANTLAIPTGFTKLDIELDGGLYEGLYIMGAISSLGKTSFILQTVDQIARRGQDVLIFSLEMSRFELMAKSLSRLTYEHSDGNVENAKTARRMMTGAQWKFHTHTQTEIINRSVKDYQEYSRHIFIHEGVGDIGVEQIKQEVQRHISFTGNTPVVVIDYLQILAPYDMRATDKQNTDKAVLELKRLSRDKKIPVIAISSFNRDNYTAPVNMASFKESGAVEYSSDVLLGLQLAGMDELSQSDSKRADTIRKIEEKKAADPRKAQIKILKNRHGKPGVSLYYDYRAGYNFFRETEPPEDVNNKTR